MKLSPVYNVRIMWAMVYDTGHSPLQPEVEFVEERFFLSKEEAETWFDENFRTENFINPRAVKVSGFEKLHLE